MMTMINQELVNVVRTRIMARIHAIGYIGQPKPHFNTISAYIKRSLGVKHLSDIYIYQFQQAMDLIEDFNDNYLQNSKLIRERSASYARKYSHEELRLIRSKVMTLAAALIKQKGLTRSHAMRTAWRMVKQRFYTKVVGVTFDDRQKGLQYLFSCDPRLIRVSLQREQDNEYDENAIAVVVTVLGQGSKRMGYIKKEYASVYARLLDKGHSIDVRFEEVTLRKGSTTFGMNISYLIDTAAHRVAQQERRASSRQEERSLIS